MKRKSTLITLSVGVVISVAAALALAAEDKYTLKVPGGLAFSEFRGYEAWQAISISRNERMVAVILGNPVMIDAYRAGIPGNDKPVPDGAKMAKVLGLSNYAVAALATSPMRPSIHRNRRQRRRCAVDA